MRKLFSLSLCLWSSFVFAQAGGLVNGSRAFPVPNDGTTGTLLNGTATIDSAGQAIQATPANTTVPVFIVVGGAGLGGNAALAAQGTMAACTMDATIASGGGNYWVIQSTTNTPECHPQATAPGAGVWVIGYLLSSSTVSGSAALVLVDSFIYGGTGGGGGGSGTVNPNPGSVGAAAFYNCNASCTVVTPNLNITFDSSGDATFTRNVTGASFISPGDWLLTTPFAGASLACSAPDSCSGINTDGNFYVSNNGGPFSVALTPLLLTPAIVGNAAFGSGGGTANAPTWTHLHSNAITAYVPDMELALVPTAANTSSTVTLQADGIASPVTVYRTGCSLANGDLNNSTLAIFRYDGGKSAFLLLNPQSACGGGGSGSLSGMTANGIPIAATSSTVTSSLNSNVTGATPTFQNGASPVASNPGVADSSSSPVTSANFTFACPSSTSIADDGHTIRFQSGASTPIIPLSSSTGCANVVVVVMDDGAGSLVFSRTSPDTFSVFNGATNTDSATSFTLTNGEFASLNQAASGIWEVRITQGGALSAITAATNTNTVASGNNYGQVWNWALTTNSVSAMTLGETTAATGGTLTSALANQAIFGLGTLSGSTATPFTVTQGSITGTVAFPAAQLQTTWNNASLVGNFIYGNVTNTASAAGSTLINLAVGNTSQFKVDKAGNGAFVGTLTCSAATCLGSDTATTQAYGTSNTTVATTDFVANAVAGTNPATAVLIATTSNLTGTYVQVGGGIGDTFTITATGATTIDGVALTATGQPVLLKNQSTASQNGIYTVTVVGTTGISTVFTRALDYDTVADVNNTGPIFVQSGTANTITSWLLTSQVTSIGSAGSSLTYSQSSSNPANLVLAISPGVGIAHFAGSTNTVTSSLIVAADITSATITGTQLASSLALTTPNIGAATGTSLIATGIVDGKAPVTVTTGTTATLGAATYSSGYTFNQEATAGTAVTYTLPATAVGLQYCVRNSIVSGTGAADTGVLTVYPPSSSYLILNGVRNTIGGGGTHGVASGGAAGDSACFVAIDATDWEVYVQRGTWTAN